MAKSISLSKQNEIFLKKHLQQEWNDAEKAMKRHELVTQSKVVGKVLMKSFFVLLVLGGVVTIAAIAPNVFAAYGKLRKRRRFYDASSFQRTFRYMRNQNYVQVHRTQGEYRVVLTPHGKHVALNELAKEVRISSKKKEEGIWWIVMFDIPRRHNHARDALRARLRMLGMEEVQQSVYASQFSCREEVLFVARLFSVSQFVTIVRATSIEALG